MKKLIFTTTIASILVLSGIAALPLSAQDAKPATPPDSSLSIPACAWQEYEVAGIGQFERGGTLGNDYGGMQYYVPVNLPQGARIRKILLICMDDDASLDMTLTISRVGRNLTGSNFGTLSTTGSDSSWRKFSTTSISPRFVNNLKFCYYIVLTMNADATSFKLYQVYVLYDAP